MADVTKGLEISPPRTSEGSRRTGFEPVTRCRFGAVEIDFERYSARRRGRLIHLTKKEMAILLELVSGRGKVIRREELLDRVWGIEACPSLRAVDTHVWSLRRKLEPNPARPRYILAVHGVGYRWGSGGFTKN